MRVVRELRDRTPSRRLPTTNSRSPMRVVLYEAGKHPSHRLTSQHLGELARGEQAGKRASIDDEVERQKADK